MCSYVRTCIICAICVITYIVAANIAIAHPGQDVELLCSLSYSVNTGWLVDKSGPYGASSLRNGIVDGYSAHLQTNNLIILNIMMNDNRNGTEYQCVINGGMSQEGDTIILYVAGEF